MGDLCYTRHYVHQQRGMLLQKYRDTNGSCIAMVLKSTQQPKNPLTEGPSTQESHPDNGRGFSTEETIKIKHFGREELIQTAASWGEKGRKTAKTQPESSFRCILIGWILGRSLTKAHHRTETITNENLAIFSHFRLRNGKANQELPRQTKPKKGQFMNFS